MLEEEECAGLGTLYRSSIYSIAVATKTNKPNNVSEYISKGFLKL